MGSHRFTATLLSLQKGLHSVYGYPSRHNNIHFFSWISGIEYVINQNTRCSFIAPGALYTAAFKENELF